MKGFDPVLLIKFGIFALVFLGKAISSINNKRKKSNDNLRPPQSAPGPAPISSPTMNQSPPKANQSQPTMNQPPMPRAPNSPKGKSSDAGSPWSSSQNPFD